MSEYFRDDPATAIINHALRYPDMLAIVEGYNCNRAVANK